MQPRRGKGRSLLVLGHRYVLEGWSGGLRPVARGSPIYRECWTGRGAWNGSATSFYPMAPSQRAGCCEEMSRTAVHLTIAAAVVVWCF
jgi:hypothetical protein